ncbi:hypothetical protein CR51_14320 [Caballeronia megalochromosomata]|jgi:uncharacterized SAM-binding protein YcdF (DUF218 family)|nr:hypothetical protein CR51_14320 [Caballeronia megalochromosomata]
MKIVLSVWLLLSVALASIGLLTRPHPADIAVVPGNTVDRNGNPSPRLAARLNRALQCYEQRQCAAIFVSGGIDTQGTNEATSMRAWLVRQGVPVESVIEDASGEDTWATARHASEFMRNRGLTKAIVVTQYFHLPRAMLALKRFGIVEVSGTYPQFWEVRDLYSMAREVPAFLWYVVRPMI